MEDCLALGLFWLILNSLLILTTCRHFFFCCRCTCTLIIYVLIIPKFLFQFPLLFAMLFLNFFADAQPKYVDLEGIIHLLSIILSSEYLLFSASRRPHSRGVCLLPFQDDLLMVPSQSCKRLDVECLVRFFGFAWTGWKKEILDEDLWSLTLPNR